jgi:hypothetical protein
MARPKKAPEGEAPVEETKAPEGEAPVLVLMTRSENDANGGPTTADVHPDEVLNWIAYGWSVKEK